MPISSCLVPLTRSVGLFKRYTSVTRALYERYTRKTSVTRRKRALQSVTRTLRGFEAKARGLALPFSTNVTRTSFCNSGLRIFSRTESAKQATKRPKTVKNRYKISSCSKLHPGRSVGMGPDRYIPMHPLVGSPIRRPFVSLAGLPARTTPRRTPLRRPRRNRATGPTSAQACLYPSA